MVRASSLALASLLVALFGVDAAPAPAADPEWEAYKSKYRKSYKTSDEEEARHGLFTVSKARVASLNALNGEKAFGINWMSDRYAHEQHKTGLVKPKDFVPNAPVRDDLYPAKTGKSINWRYTEAVTAIKNQGQCGSCWAFSATEAVESQMILATGGKLAVALSPQQVASCSPSSGKWGCQGCNGGFTEGAYEYLKSSPGLSNAFYIPYEQSLVENTPTAACPTAKVESIGGEMEQLQGGYAQIKGYHYATPPCTSGECASQDLEKLKKALEHTPVSVCVNAGVWNDYVGGVMSSKACGPMGAMYQDHCVMATGFNVSAPTPYWIVRNSWASTWGEEGYVYLEMAKNTCGIADDATIPEVKLDMTVEEEEEAAARRELMYSRATQ
jgi:C1A family cysteine protease